MLNAGIIGLGRMGAEPSTRLEGKVPNGWLPTSHIEALMSSKDVVLKAICDLNMDRVKWVSDYYKLQATKYSAPLELFNEQLDIITIATRTPERYDLLMHALKHAVKAIVVEKPLANSIMKSSEIITNVVDKNCILGYGAARRAMNIYQQAKEIIQSGEVGEVQSIVAEFGYSKLLWTLPHAVDLFLFYANTSEVDYVSGHCSFNGGQLLNPNNFDGDPLVESATIKFKNGVVANIVPGNGLNIRLGCSKGIVTIHGDGDFIEINFPDKYSSYYTGSKKIENHYENSGICNIYSSIIKSLRDNIPFNIIKPQEIETSQKILFGIMQSSLAEGKRLSISSLNEEFYISGRTGNFYA